VESRFSEEQIIGVLREEEIGASTEEVCRRGAIGTMCAWNSSARESRSP
jgi:hypothetical protein